jgi:hypothetical protein
MENGTLSAGAYGARTGVYWHNAGQSQRWSPGELLNSAFILANFTSKRCRNCKIIVLGHSPEMLKPYKEKGKE